MIELHSDCLMFQMSDGEAIPCYAELVTVEMIGNEEGLLDTELVRNATRAVLHYFKVEMGRTSVTVGEFSNALASVLRRFGLIVKSTSAKTPRRILESDLRQLACQCGKWFELSFFPRLRDQLRQQLIQSPQVVCFTGLRSCVKQLAGARRWSGRCQKLNDQIVEYLRQCLAAEPSVGNCSLLVV